ncbi:MAG TPA: TonB-dependent receptor plug domain-containing protein, partial [Duganella sp.]
MSVPVNGSHAASHRLNMKLSVAVLVGAGVLSSASVWAQAPVEQTAPAETATVVVTGVKASLIKSLAIKRTNDQVVESVVAEDIGKLPDNNVVEALQRVTGIQVTNRSGGEVGTLSIRGLPDV